jgi:L-seryl-tRNA(Ser) seleniumtransferase
MSQLRDLPRVDAVAADPVLNAFPESIRVRAARMAIETIRHDLLEGKITDIDNASTMAFEIAQKMTRPSLRDAINLTGVVLHTGLGRARLAKPVVDQMLGILSSHCLVELDIETGKRGSRQDHVKGMLKELTGAEDILVVNNCASSVLLTLMCLCSGKEVILSRGEMIEIGGSFRMPDIVRQSGCQLVEVGCTNKTHLRDYEEAITENTGAILHCHQSNYKMVGFVLRQTLQDLAELGRKRNVMVIEDIGAGCLLDTSLYGLPREETLQEAIAAGPDVVLSSGDKLLGGPQCGILLGKASVIGRIKKHPLARALRVDKLTMTALEGTLRLYIEGRERELPVWHYISASMESVKDKAKKMAKAYKGKTVVQEGITEIGGGSLPGSGVPTWRVGFPSASPEQLLKEFRMCEPPLIGRIEDDLVWLDPRTLEDDELPRVVQALENLSQEP